MSGEVMGVQLEMGVMGEVGGERFREVWQLARKSLRTHGRFSEPSSAEGLSGLPATKPTKSQAVPDIQPQTARLAAFPVLDSLGENCGSSEWYSMRAYH
jgi:hypothetical protein